MTEQQEIKNVETKNPVGMPRGTVQYPEVMKLIQENLTKDPQNISQIMDKVKAQLSKSKLSKSKKSVATLNRDTIKHYLELLEAEGKVKKCSFGKYGKFKTFSLP